MHSGLFTGTKGDKEYKKQECKTMTEIISQMNFFAKRIEKLEDIKAGDLKCSVEHILDAGNYTKKDTGDVFARALLKDDPLFQLYDTDEEYKEVVDTARFEQARLIEQTRNNLLPIYKKKLNALAKELAGVD